MLAPTPFALFADPPDLGTTTAAQERRLHGQRVTVLVTVGESFSTWKGRTIYGAADRPDGIERGAILKGERYGTDEGDTGAVTGTLRYGARLPTATPAARRGNAPARPVRTGSASGSSSSTPAAGSPARPAV